MKIDSNKSFNSAKFTIYDINCIPNEKSEDSQQFENYLSKKLEYKTKSFK